MDLKQKIIERNKKYMTLKEVSEKLPFEGRFVSTVTLRKWFDDCGADFSGTEKDCGHVINPSVEGTLQSRYPMGRYRGIETFGTL